MNRSLTLREQEILVFVAQGKSNRSMADRLGVSVRTVEGHRARLMLKLGLTNLADIVKYALRNGLIEP